MVAENSIYRATTDGLWPQLKAAQDLLEQIGASLTVDSLSSTRPLPTFSGYIPVVSAAISSGTRRVYGSYWRKIIQHWGGRAINEPTSSEIKQLIEQVRADAVVRRNSRGGRSSAEHLISAFRCLYNHAIADGLIRESDNPARNVAKPRRLPSTRRALSDHQIAEINRVAAKDGNDPQLDTLILRLHTETACRRAGALALRPCDLDSESCLILLREKAGVFRWQPVSPTLMGHLQQHVYSRHDGMSNEQLLRYRNDMPITYRRYDYLWTRVGRELSWVTTQGVSTHWLRHTTLTWVERHFGYAIAKAYAGHADRADTAATSTYIRASVEEVATALAALTGEAHPLSPTS